MTKLLVGMASRFLRGRWGSLIPSLLKGAGEGQFGEAAKKVYWFGNGYATVTGAIFLAVGTAAEALAAGYPEWPWLVPTAQYVYQIGGVLAAAGLLRGAVNSPWPDGAQNGHKEK